MLEWLEGKVAMNFSLLTLSLLTPSLAMTKQIRSNFKRAVF